MHQYDIRDLRIHFPTRRGVVEAVRGVSFYMDQGECVALVGESGCGKSVTARSLMGLTEVTGGRCQPGSQILCHGENILDYSKKQWQSYRGRDAAMIFQDAMTSLNPTMQIGHQIAECYRFHQKIGRKEALEKAAEMLALVGISDPEAALRRYPHEFSGGMRQRIGIARALAVEPRLLLCDEPISALDVSIQAQIVNLLLDLREQKSLTYLLISHDLSMVRHLSDRILVMYLGEVVEESTAQELYTHPLHPYTKALFSAIPVPDPTVKMDRIVLEGSIPSPANPPAGCKFHTRCANCMEKCKTEVPQQREIEPGHYVVCHLYDEA